MCLSGFYTGSKAAAAIHSLRCCLSLWWMTCWLYGGESLSLILCIHDRIQSRTQTFQVAACVSCGNAFILSGLHAQLRRSGSQRWSSVRIRVKATMWKLLNACSLKARCQKKASWALISGNRFRQMLENEKCVFVSIYLCYSSLQREKNKWHMDHKIEFIIWNYNQHLDLLPQKLRHLAVVSVNAFSRLIILFIKY